MKKCYELELQYFKKGDDLGYFLNEAKAKAKTIKERQKKALLMHADMMDESSNILRIIADLVSKGKTKILQADAHIIILEVDEKIADKLGREGILSKLKDE